MKLRASQIHDVYLSDSKSNYVAKTAWRKGFRIGIYIGLFIGFIACFLAYEFIK